MLCLLYLFSPLDLKCWNMGWLCKERRLSWICSGMSEFWKTSFPFMGLSFRASLKNPKICHVMSKNHVNWFTQSNPHPLMWYFSEVQRFCMYITETEFLWNFLLVKGKINFDPFSLACSDILTNEYSETYYTDDGTPVTSTPEALVSQVNIGHFIYTTLWKIRIRFQNQNQTPKIWQ